MYLINYLEMRKEYVDGPNQNFKGRQEEKSNANKLIF